MTHAAAALLLVSLAITAPCHSAQADQVRAANTAPRLVKASPAMASAVDRHLNRIRLKNKGYPAVLAAIDRTASEIKAHPQEFVSADGKLDVEKMNNAVLQSMQGLGKVDVPDAETANEVSGDPQRGRKSER